MPNERSVARAKPLSPELQLVQALSEYEAVLDSDQKIKLHEDRRTSPPSVNNVMRLTAEIDRDAGQNRKLRQCVGPRLTNVLQLVQKFVSAVDVIVGGSQSQIACAVWGVLKMSLLVASTVSSYFDQLSQLFMNIGRSCPRYQDLGLLYPKSTRLRDALYGYLIVIVKFCKKTVQFMEKRSIVQSFSAILKPFETEFGGFQQMLEQCAASVREEASLCAKQEHRDLFKGIKKQKEQDARRRFLSACSTYSHETAWKQARKKGNTGWVHSTEEYMHWKQATNSSTIWCTGILGCGKTVISANVVSDLFITAPEAVIAYFFCRYDDVTSLRTRTIIGSIARQVLASAEADFTTISQQDITTLDTEQILDYLETLLPMKPRRYFIIIDGLDECDEKDIELLLQYLKRLMMHRTHMFQIYCSSRPDTFQRAAALVEPQWSISISNARSEMSESSSEMAQYIDTELEQCLESETLCLRNPEIILRIRDTLMENAHGMYLWVVFQIESICSQKTDDSILKALEDLPKDMPETFDRILRKLEHSQYADRAFCRKVYDLIAAAQRPLTLGELQEAVSIEPGVTLWNPERLVNNMLKSLRCCGSLIAVDEENLTIHFVHHSVRQYLLSQPTSTVNRGYHTSLKEADLRLGGICVTYLSLGIFDKKITRVIPEARKINYPSVILRGSLAQSNSVKKLALRLLKNRPDTSRELPFQLKDAAGLSENASATRTEDHFQEHPFIPYAQKFWLAHSKAFSDTGMERIYPLWCNLINGMVDTVTLPWAPETISDPGDKFIGLVILELHVALINECFKHSDHVLQLEELNPYTDANSKELEILEKLLSRLPLEFYIEKDFLERKLLFATTRGKETLVRMLLQRGADVNARSGRFGNALQAAAVFGMESIVRLLLNNKADVNARGGRYGNALQAAATFENESTIRLLLDNKADVNAQGGYYGNALQAAAACGMESIVRLLLDNKADVNARGGPNGNALQAAAAFGHESVIRLLLNNKANINAQGGHYGNALQAAIRNQPRHVKLLLERGAIVTDANMDEAMRGRVQGRVDERAVQLLKSYLEEQRREGK
ncbi:hypothetical protein MMC18_009178 [Xylographa bjoerkii]|nr:hypothetical protein [Xylographa bjoerkii]